MKPCRETKREREREGGGSKKEKKRDRVIGVYLVGWKNLPAAARRSPVNFLRPLASTGDSPPFSMDFSVDFIFSVVGI